MTILVAPLLALAFLVCALFTLYRSPRFAFLAATAMEAVVTAYAGAAWFAPMLLHGEWQARRLDGERWVTMMPSD
jgi:hypothetical protein